MARFPRLTVLSAAIVVLGITMLGKNSRLAVAQEDPGQMKAARQQAAQSLGMMYNDDNVDAQVTTPEEFLAARLQHMADTQIDVVTFDPCDVDNIAIYPSKIAQFTEVYALAVAGHDPVALALGFCHGNDLQFYPSFRMNDVHESLHKDWWRTAQWKRDHPEYLLGEHGDNTRYPLSSPRAWWAAKDYAVPAVRERQFLLIEEMCENYDLDGVELDFFRSPLYFRPTLDLEPVEAEHLYTMNNFMRRIRAMTEQIGRQRGRPLLVAPRVPMSVERSRAIGLDVQTWLEEDLVDILIIGGGYAPMAMALQVRQMVHFADRYDVPVYACISASGMKEHHNLVEAWRGAAMNIHRAGAQVYLFNFPYGLLPPDVDSSYRVYHSSPQQIQLYTELGSPETLKGLDKRYGIDYLLKDTFQGCTRPALVAPGRLPVELPPGQWTRLHLPVGEDIVANTPEGKSCHTRLRLRASTLGAADKVQVRLNGEPLTPVSDAEPITAVGANLLTNPAFEQGEEIGENVPAWRGSGYDGTKHSDADFVITSAGRNDSWGAVLELDPSHIWALADQHVKVQISPDQTLQFSVWLRAEQPDTRVRLTLLLHLPEQKLYDVAASGTELAVGTEWQSFQTLLDLTEATALPDSLQGAQIRAIIQPYQPATRIYVDDTSLITGRGLTVEFELDPQLVKAGDNLIELHLAPQQPTGPVAVDRLDLTVRYQ